MTDLSSRVGVVVPAGGAGLRLGGDAKQFRALGGAPVLVQTLRAFARCAAVGPLVVAVPAGREAEAADALGAAGVEARVVSGGPTRQASVACGVAALPADVDVVLVHDAVRPFVSRALVSAVIAGVRVHGAAAAATPVADTLRRAAGERLAETVDRAGLWAMQTPQGARRDLIALALERPEAATDEAGLLVAAGVPVAVVPGDARNVKITTPTDWALAEALWPAWAAGEGAP